MGISIPLECFAKETGETLAKEVYPVLTRVLLFYGHYRESFSATISCFRWNCYGDVSPVFWIVRGIEKDQGWELLKRPAVAPLQGEARLGMWLRTRR